MTKTMIRTLLFVMMLAFGGSAAWAQCAPGVPCGGNPMGIPPDQPNSPYNTGAGAYGGPTGNGTVSGGGTWSAFVIDDNGHVSWYVHARNARAAERGAMANCARMGGKGCQVIESFTGACGAPSVDAAHELFMGWGTGPNGTEQSAIEKCERDSKVGQCRLVSLTICDMADINDQITREISDRAGAATPAELEKISARYRRKH